MLFRITDIETVPDPSTWTPGQPDWILRPGTKLSGIPLEGSGAFFHEVRPVGSEPRSAVCHLTYVKKEPFCPPQSQRVVAVAWCDVDLKTEADKPKTYDLVSCHVHADWSDDPATESGLLRLFRDAMVARPANLVTWNGRSFDLPVLAMRALHLGVPWGWYYDSRDIRYRYSTEGHNDLMDFLSDYGACRSMKLDDVARLVGLPGKDVPGEDHFDGSMVAGVVAEGDVPANKKKIARYCLQDVIQTALVFLRTRYHLEIVTADEYNKSVETFSSSKVVKKTIDLDWSKVLLPGSFSSDSPPKGGVLV